MDTLNLTQRVSKMDRLGVALMKVKEQITGLTVKKIAPRKKKLSRDSMLIAGPCALESREQLRVCAQELKRMGIRYVRASLFKPRTSPGWEGLGVQGIPILLEETLPLGLIPATEVLTAEQARELVSALKAYGKEGKLLVWIGSRNQNHMELKKIVSVLAKVSDRVELMVKNQMWEEERHWQGIVDHLLETGYPLEQLSMCHRGFAPGRASNPQNLRNLPNMEMAMRIKEKNGIRMILDPSHIGGSKEKVLRMIEEGLGYPFDGQMIEVHHTPHLAKTDRSQQLSPWELEELLEDEDG